MSARFVWPEEWLLNWHIPDRDGHATQPAWGFLNLTVHTFNFCVRSFVVARVWESRVIPLAANVVWARAKQMLWLNLRPAMVAGPVNTISIGDTRTAGS